MSSDKPTCMYVHVQSSLYCRLQIYESDNHITWGNYYNLLLRKLISNHRSIIRHWCEKLWISQRQLVHLSSTKMILFPVMSIFTKTVCCHSLNYPFNCHTINVREGLYPSLRYTIGCLKCLQILLALLFLTFKNVTLLL